MMVEALISGSGGFDYFILLSVCVFIVDILELYHCILQLPLLLNLFDNF